VHSLPSMLPPPPLIHQLVVLNHMACRMVNTELQIQLISIA